MYNTSLSSFTPSSPSASPYVFPYSGIGGSPNPGPDDAPNSQIGLVSMKEDTLAVPTKVVGAFIDLPECPAFTEDPTDSVSAKRHYA